MKDDYELDEKTRVVTLTEAGNEHVEQLSHRGGHAQGRVALRHRERHRRASRAAGAPRPHAVPARPRLHRQERRGDHHRRVHRPHDAGPALFRRAAPGARGQGARHHPAREPDPRLHHLPELFPPLREARRHDRHGGDRSRRVHGHLRPRRGRGADQHGHDPRRRGRRGLSHGAGEIPGHHHSDQGCAEARPADAGRHHLDREIGDPRPSC